MKKTSTLIITLFLSFMCLLQAKSQSLTEQQKELIKNEVNEVFTEMLVFAEKLDYDKLSFGVDDKHEAGFITNKKYYSRYASLIDDMKLGARGVSGQEISIKQKKLTVLSDKIVLLTASGLSKAKLDDGRDFTVDFHWSFIFEKIDNKWKVIYSHQSSAN